MSFYLKTFESVSLWQESAFLFTCEKGHENAFSHINEVIEPVAAPAETKGDKKKNFVIKQTDKNKRRDIKKKPITEVSPDKPKTSFQIHKIEE